MTYQGKPKNRTFENVKGFWDATAHKFGKDPSGVIRDIHFRNLEITETIKYLSNDDDAIDVGCGNGYGTSKFASFVKTIIGVDYSKTFVDIANGLSRFQNTSFAVADARSLPFTDNKFNKVIAQRLLINLPGKEDQFRVLDELHRILKPNGFLISTEVTRQGHAKIDEYRRKAGLLPLEKYWHNLYIDEDEFFEYIKGKFEVLKVRRFGMYHFVSKILHPLIVFPNEPKFDARINEVARKLANRFNEFEDCSHQLLAVLKKL